VIALGYAAIWLLDPEGTAAATGVPLRRIAGRLTTDAVVYLVYALEMAAIGGLSLWPGLRVRVHAALAVRGESVATAAGIGALIVGCESDQLAAVARDTFRYVRLNTLKPWHLSGSGDTAFALSAPAQLGSIDVRRAADAGARARVRRGHACVRAATVRSRASCPFRLSLLWSLSLARSVHPFRLSRALLLALSARRSPRSPRQAFVTHSWRDDPLTKYRLLQAWRMRFIAAHGREPTVWLDVCCLDPRQPGSYVPCLPVYVAGCHSLLALCGSTFTSRLWCMVELFVFYEMRSAGARGIEIVRFDFPHPSNARADVPRLIGQRLPSVLNFTFDPSGIIHEMPFDEQPSLTSTIDSLIDVRNATCSLELDRQNLLGVIENCGVGGADEFNLWLRKLFTTPSTSHSDRQTRTQAATRAPPL
jgi:hypothetical protein